MAWLTGWSHRKAVTITGQSGAGTDYQVKLSIGASAGGNFHLEGNCTNFPQDIVVTDNDGTTLLDHWVEDLTTDPITLWVEVADDLGSNVDVYIYYDKSGESSASNGTSTFPDSFDNFSDGNYTGWTIVDSETGDSASAASYQLVMTKGANAGEFQMTSPDTGQITEKKNWVCQMKSHDVSAILLNGDEGTPGFGAIYVIMNYLTTGTLKYYTGGAFHTIATSLIADGTYWIIIIPDVSTDTFDIHVYDSSWNEITYSGANTGLNFRQNTTYLNRFRPHTYYANGVVTYDTFYIREYNSPEPTFSSAGSEENSPSAYTYGSRRAYSILF